VPKVDEEDPILSKATTTSSFPVYAANITDILNSIIERKPQPAVNK
jgi:hypothetical protein